MAGLIPPDKLEQIRAASDIVEVIGGYIPLKRGGANFVALCPFHKEKSPSFNVNPHKQIFRCFGCGKGGDVFSFIREYEGIGFMDAVRRLAERAHIPLEFENTPGAQQARHIKDTLLQIHEQITQRWQNALTNEAGGQIARDYLTKRGVSPEAVELFRLGYAPEAWDDTVNWAKSKNFELPIVEQAGLIIQKEGTDRYYDRFRGRLIFPICDEQGRVIGFSGRILSGDEKVAKYVNSPETPIFSKGRVFFGLDKSKRAILDAKFAIICEGQLDLIACFMGGVKNIIAPQGTAFTENHARILKRYADEVVLCFDSDNAGQNAAVRALDSLLASGLAVRVAIVPAPHDPDSFIKANGGEAFQKLIEGGQGFFDYFLGRLCATNDIATDKGRLTVLKSMAEAVNKTGSAVLADTYAQKTAQRLAVGVDSVRAEFKKIVRSQQKPFAMDAEVEYEEESALPVEAAPLPRPSPQEFWLLKLMLLHDDQLEWVAAHLDPAWLQHPLVSRIVTARIEAQHNETWRGVAAFLDDFEDEASRSLITEASFEDRNMASPEALLKGEGNKMGTVQTLRNDYIDRQIAEMQKRLTQPDLPDDQIQQFDQQKRRQRELKKQPLTQLADEY